MKTSLRKLCKLQKAMRTKATFLSTTPNCLSFLSPVERTEGQEGLPAGTGMGKGKTGEGIKKEKRSCRKRATRIYCTTQGKQPMFY